MTEIKKSLASIAGTKWPITRRGSRGPEYVGYPPKSLVKTPAALSALLNSLSLTSLSGQRAGYRLRFRQHGFSVG